MAAFSQCRGFNTRRPGQTPLYRRLVVALFYGHVRETADLDFIECRPVGKSELESLAGEGSEIHKQHKMYLDPVTVAQTPECYEDRLAEMLPGHFTNLRLFVLEIHDLMLTKLMRNSLRDQTDILNLSTDAQFDIETFKHRYDTEMKVYIEHLPFHAGTFEYWLDIIEEHKTRLP